MLNQWLLSKICSCPHRSLKFYTIKDFIIKPKNNTYVVYMQFSGDTQVWKKKKKKKTFNLTKFKQMKIETRIQIFLEKAISCWRVYFALIRKMYFSISSL